MKAWFCTHRDTIAIGDKRAHSEMYCRANRRCDIGDDGCHEIEVTQEFVDTYQGPIFGTVGDVDIEVVLTAFIDGGYGPPFKDPQAPLTWNLEFQATKVDHTLEEINDMIGQTFKLVRVTDKKTNAS